MAMSFVAEMIADPYPVYARLRESGPVHEVELPDGSCAWFVGRYEHVRSGLADPRLSLSKSNSRGTGYQGFSLPPALDANLLNMDDPDHSRLRKLVSQEFMAPAVDPSVIRGCVEGLLDQMAAEGRVSDVVAGLAVPLPVMVIGDMLGIPAEDRDRFRGWTNALLGSQTGDRQAGREAVASMVEYLATLIADKRKHPSDDLLSRLVLTRDSADRLTEDELMSLAFLLLWAGYENSVKVIGNSVLALLRQRDQWEEIRKLPGWCLPDGAVSELLRFAEPNQFAIRRFPTEEEVSFGGVSAPIGATVLLGIASANRDPGHFPKPDVVDIHRYNSRNQLSLGRGPHFCLGSALAKVEVGIAIKSLIDRFPELHLAVEEEDLVWSPSFRNRGLVQLPVKLTA